MKKILLTILMTTFFSQANAFELRCTAQKPCLHQKDLGLCLKKEMDFRIFESLGAIIGVSNNSIKEITLEEIRVSPDAKDILVSDYIKGNMVGDNYIILKSQDGFNYTGELVLEEDFPFKIKCYDFSRFYEPRAGVRN